MNKLAQFISIIFHPILLPTWMFLIFIASVSKNRDLLVGDHGYQVNDPEDEAEEEEAQNTHNKGDNILGLDIAENTVDSCDQATQKDLENDLNDLRQFVIHSGEGRFVRHCKCPPKYFIVDKQHGYFTTFFQLCQSFLHNIFKIFLKTCVIFA